MSEDPRLERLFTDEDRLPRALVEEILRDGTPLASRLAEIIDDARLWDAEPPRDWAPLHATLLLAALRPAGSFEPVSRGLERAIGSFDSFIDDAASSILAAYVGPTLEPVRSLLRNPERDDVLRQEACAALVVAAGRRPDLRGLMTEELRHVAADRTGSRDLRAVAASYLLGLLDPKDREFLLNFERNDYFDPDYVQEAYERQARAPFPPPVDWLEFYSPEALERREHELEAHAREASGGEEMDLEDLPAAEIVRPDPAGDLVEAMTDATDPGALPFRREIPKVGRNDPCPCGSGAKFKKCCGK
jgi:hypothetical protein